MTTAVGTNWAGNLAYSATEIARPTSVEELADVLRGASRVRALGTRHSFNRIADTHSTLVSVSALPSVADIFADQRLVRVSAGTRYGDLAAELQAGGWALPNLASLPHISVAGAVATGTHGSGDRVPSLAASVARVEFVTPDGDLHSLKRGDADFEGAVVSLGALGVMVAIDLDIVPSFEIAQTVFEGLPWDGVLADLDAVTALGYSTSMFTTWRDADVVDQLWMKARVDAGGTVPDEVLGARPAPQDRHPLPGVSAVNCTPQQGSAGPWLDRLPHFRMGFQPSNGEELQSEYLVPRRFAVEALGTLRSLAGRISPLLQVCEVRTVASDGLWLSSSYETDAVGLHFTWLPDQPGVEAFLPDLEAALAPFDARPHWGKLFVRRDVGRLYPRWSDFAALRERFDPRGVLRNDWMAELGL
ncbi:FAD-binding protein [Microbacterium sp. DT81.1]|uniref:FAD-binding protein n=1 Tax=Microbacterium sp. DT81.1 TaxID=3393413 RepID=UPI003CEEC440